MSSAQRPCPAAPPRRAGFAVPALAALLGVLAWSATAPAILGAENEKGPPRPKLTREIFVPLEDLDVLLEGHTQRVFLTRDEYRELVEKASRTPERRAPLETALLSAEYDAVIEEGRAVINGQLAVEVLQEGLHALEMPLGGVGVRSASLDGEPASLTLDPNGRPLLLVEGLGVHRLTLQMTAPLETSAADQRLTFALPAASATRLQLTAPGNVNIKSGAHVLRREVDGAADATRFELLAPKGPTSLVMTLNNRLQRQQRLVVCRSVIVDELTRAYERLHATVSLEVLHAAVDRFRFAVPEGFDVTNVASPLLARWNVERAGEQNILEVVLSEAVTDTVVLNISATRAGERLTQWLRLGGWTLPQWKALDTVGQAAVVGLLLEDGLSTVSLASEGLIPIDNAVLVEALPETVFQVPPGAPAIRPIAAYYAPETDYRLEGQFKAPPRKLNVTTNLLLILNDQQHQMRGGFALLPETEKLFSLEFRLPTPWQVSEVTDQDGRALAVERYEDQEGGARLYVRLPQGVPAGQQANVYFHASTTPDDWLNQWDEQAVVFPAVAVRGATRDIGAIAVQGLDDLQLRPDQLAGLTPLDDSDKAKYGLADTPTDLAYRFETPDYQASFVVQRAEPWVTAQTYSFFRVESTGLSAHYEVVYQVQRARVRSLSLSLPVDTPAALSIGGLDDAAVKEYSSEIVGDRRVWTALLAEARIGRIRLAVDFQSRLEQQEPKGLTLPLARAEQVAYQTAIGSVEGASDLDINVATSARKVDVGQLALAQYQVGRRLLGAFLLADEQEQLRIDVSRRPGYGLPLAIVQRAELATLVSTNGLSQTAARFQLRTKASFLEMRLPPEATLWSVRLDGRGIVPQRDGDSLLLSFPSADASQLRDLQVVYEAPFHANGFYCQVDVRAPKLLLRSDEGEAGEAPLADVSWRLFLPADYQLVRSEGSVYTRQLQLEGPESRAFQFAVFGMAESRMARMTGAEAVKSRALASSQRLRRGLGMAAEGDEYAGDVDYEQQTMEAAPTASPMSAGRPMTESLLADAPQTAVPAEPQPAPPPANRESVSDLAFSADGRALATSSGDKTVTLWALQGVRSLQIDLDQFQGGQSVLFRSLGAEPRLAATLADGEKLNRLAWGVGLLVAIFGVALTRRAVRTKVRYVIAVALLALALPLLTGWIHEFGHAFQAALAAACLLVPYYLAAGLVRSIASLPQRFRARRALAAALVLASLTAGASPAAAAPPTEEDLAPPPPVSVPNDAVIVPYDPEQGWREAAESQQVLVPYQQYAELWNRAYPDRKLEQQAPPAPFAVSSAELNATLEGDEYLIVQGRLEVNVFVSRPVAIPLALEGGVLASATLGGRPARLQLVRPQPPPARQQAANQAPSDPAASRAMYLLHVDTKGRQQLDVTIRLRLRRSGGWRIADGRLPAALATSLNLRVPEPQTEVRLSGTPDRSQYETKESYQQIETSLLPDGKFAIQWRPHVAQGQVDQSLTATSDAYWDIREDGLRVLWSMSLQFRNSQRESFTLYVPNDYLVQRVSGDNVRGFRVDASGQRQTLEVTLLRPALEREQVTVQLAKHMAIGQHEQDTLTAPVVAVEGAAMQQGKITIRRSPLLSLQVTAASGLTRTDASDRSSEPQFDAAGGDESPLGVRPYQAYRFVTTSYEGSFSAASLAPQMTAETQMLVKIAERETQLECRLNLTVQDRPAYRVEAYLPADLQIDQVSAPGEYQWSEQVQDGRKLLSVFLAAGQQGRFSILVLGKLSQSASEGSVAAPAVEVRDVGSQQGQIVVQADPAFDVRPEQLQGCETILLSRVMDWLAAEQRSLARVALQYLSPGYAAVLRVTARTPRVNVVGVTNVHVTDTAVEETILLELQIQQAGLREVQFLMPESLRSAKISAPMLRQKTIETVPAPPAAAPLENLLRVRLELQDEVMGQFRVLIQNDRLLAASPQRAPFVLSETGGVVQRFLTLESAGRDEIVVTEEQGLEPVSRQQRAWQALGQLLGGEATTAYAVRSDVNWPQFVFQPLQRKTVETAGARIGLAETRLVLDANGAYRAEQEYRVDNKTEQYLQVVLPEGAQLWTVLVAGEPVKPAQASGAASSRQVRIPLIKTAAGDSDYVVLFKYGGQLAPLGAYQKIRFPVPRTENIRIEQSHVRLWLPETHRWFDFSGSMSQASGEVELEAGYDQYQAKQIQRLTQVLRGKDSFSQARAFQNLKDLKQLGSAASRDYQSGYDLSGESVQLSYGQAASQAALREAEEAAAAVTRYAEQQRSVLDNRDRLNQLWDRQQIGLARNVVQDVGSNFAAPDAAPPPMAAGSERFNRKWLEQNKFLQLGDLAEDAKESTVDELSRQSGVGGKLSLQVEQRQRLMQRGGDVSGPGAKPSAGNRPQQQQQPAAPEVAQKKVQRELLELDMKSKGAAAKNRADVSDVERYQELLESRSGSGPVQDEQLQRGQFGGGGGFGGYRGFAAGERAATNAPTDQAMPPTSGGVHLASLDVQLPYRGVQYYFTTPHGEIEIFARAADASAWSRVLRLLGVAALAVALALTGKLCRLVTRRFRRA